MNKPTEEQIRAGLDAMQREGPALRGKVLMGKTDDMLDVIAELYRWFLGEAERPPVYYCARCLCVHLGISCPRCTVDGKQGLLDLLPAPKRTWGDITNTMTREHGDLIRGLTYADNTRREGMYKAHRAEGRLGLANLILQARVLAELMEWDWTALVADGEERFRERMKELADGVL